MLQVYEESFGKKVNLAKSTLLFSKNTSQEQRRLIKNSFRVQSIDNMGKYLGIPSLVGKDRKRAFRELKEIVVAIKGLIFFPKFHLSMALNRILSQPTHKHNESK